jgi:hypothetical protein
MRNVAPAQDRAGIEEDGVEELGLPPSVQAALGAGQLGEGGTARAERGRGARRAGGAALPLADTICGRMLAGTSATSWRLSRRWPISPGPRRSGSTPTSACPSRLLTRGRTSCAALPRERRPDLGAADVNFLRGVAVGCRQPRRTLQPPYLAEARLRSRLAKSA